MGNNSLALRSTLKNKEKIRKEKKKGNFLWTKWGKKS